MTDRGRAGLFRGDGANALPVTWRDELVWWANSAPLTENALPLRCEEHDGKPPSSVDSFLGYVERPDPSVTRKRTGRTRRLRRVLVYKLLLQRCVDCLHHMTYDVEAHELWDTVRGPSVPPARRR